MTSVTASVAQCRHLLSSAESIIARLDDSHRAAAPRPGAKTAGWFVGHLTVTGDFARSLCGRAPLCPAEWGALFNPGSLPSTRAADYPPMQSLCEAFRAVSADLCAAAGEARTDAPTATNPYPPGRAAFPTAGEFLAYLLTGHLTYHMGQLVVWVEAVGVRSPGRRDVPADGAGASPDPAA